MVIQKISSEVHKLDERRKPLITVNPLFAKTSEMPPKPNIEDITYDHISLNLPSIAKNTLRELDEDLVIEKTVENEIKSEAAVNEEKISTENSTENSNDDNSDLEDAKNIDESFEEEEKNELEESKEEEAENLDEENSDKENEDDNISLQKENLKSDEVLVRVKYNGRIEKWKKSDWDDVVSAGNQDKFELL